MRYMLLALGICCVVAIGHAKVQASTALNGITVSPAIEQITLKPDQTTATYEAQVTNNTGNPVVINASAEDFTSLNQNGGISFINSDQINTNNPHGLLGYLSIGYSAIALGPGQNQKVPITILNADKLAVGGHYSALLFKVSGASNSKGNKVVINQVVSSLLFLSTYGQGTQTIGLTTPVIGSLFTTFPQTINAVFEDTGNTQTAPRGVVQILDSSSHVVSQAQINVDSSLILPQSKRLFTLNLTRTTKHVWPGIYHLRIYYRHDGQAGYSVYEQKFLFVNGSVIAAVIVVIILLAILVRKILLPKSRRPTKREPPKSGVKIPVAFDSE
jgi:methionine-rich copper-binding protein CopC